jgi:transposase-like protein
VIRRSRPVSASFAGYRFPREVILLGVRWYLRYGLSYRDVEELLAERGLEVDHVTIYRWVQHVYVSGRRNVREMFLTQAVDLRSGWHADRVSKRRNVAAAFDELAETI